MTPKKAKKAKKRKKRKKRKKKEEAVHPISRPVFLLALYIDENEPLGKQ